MVSVKSSDDMAPHRDASGIDGDLAGDYNDDFEGDDGEKGDTSSPTQSPTDNAKPGEHDISPFVQVGYLHHFVCYFTALFASGGITNCPFYIEL